MLKSSSEILAEILKDFPSQSFSRSLSFFCQIMVLKKEVRVLVKLAQITFWDLVYYILMSCHNVMS